MNIKMKTEALKEGMLAIRNVHKSDAVKRNLVEKGYGSSVSIFHRPRHCFIDDVKNIVMQEEAEQIYERARANYILLSNMTAALNTTYGSDSYRAVRSRITGDKNDTMFENMPNYQEIFGNLDYCSCPHCKSIFGPAAYFVDLLRIIERYIILDSKEEEAVPLRTRRPDLFQMKLTCENTNQEGSYLQVVNKIAEGYLNRTNLYKELSKTYYPYPLPFHLPMTSIRLQLLSRGVLLTEVLQSFQRTEESIIVEEMKVLPEVYEYLKNPLSCEALKRFWNFSPADVGMLTEITKFMQAMKLTRQEAERLFVQDIGDSEADREKLLHRLYINEGFMTQKDYLLIEDEKIKNLKLDTLERICGFLSLTRVFGVSFEEMDWLLKTAGVDEKGNIRLLLAWQITDFARHYGIPIETAAALSGDLKDYGRNTFHQIFGINRKELEEKSLDIQERILVRVLHTDLKSICILRSYLGQTDVLPIDSIYRHYWMAQMLSMRMEEYILLLTLLFSEPLVCFTPNQVEWIIEVCREIPFSVYELEYLIYLRENPYMKANDTLETLEQKLEIIRQNVPEGSEKIPEQLADNIYGELGSLLGRQPEELKVLFGMLMDGKELEEWPARIICAKAEEIKPAMDQISKLLCLADRGIGVPLLAKAAEHKEIFGVQNMKEMTVGNIRDLVFFARFTEAVQDKDGLLLRFADEYSKDRKQIKLLAEAAGWDAEQTVDIAELLCGTGKDENNISSFIRILEKCRLVMENLAFDKNAIQKLLNLAYEKFGFLTPDERYVKAAEYERELFGDLKSTETNAAIEAAKREALLPVVMLQLQKKFSDITNYNKLYKYFLIDVEMDDKTNISLVKEGINALQLYLQRCRMGLEKGVKEVAIPKSWWSWIMDYRMWEANRKIFTYPENYLVPAIRQSKTSLFKNTEDALKQSQVTDGYIEEQFVKYLDDYMQLTQLKICGAYETVEDNLNVLYVFAKTQKQPYTYYYCYQVSTLAWTEWKKIDANIDSVNITPVFIFNRLHIFWSVLKENTKVKVESSKQLNAGNQKSYHLQIKYTYLNLQGKWIVPQELSEETVVYAKDDREASQPIREKVNEFGIDIQDNSFQKLTLLRLTQKNLEGFIDKGNEFECLAVITGSFTQNLGMSIEKLEMDSSLDMEQENFARVLNDMVQNNNFEVHNGESGYFSTGYFKLFNEDLEETHLLHEREFIVVDGYIPTRHSLMYTALHDEVHHAIGVCLSQNILMDAALPSKGILPFDNSVKGPALNEESFVIVEEKNPVISRELSAVIYKKLCQGKLIDAAGYAAEKKVANADLLYLIDDLLIDEESNNEKLKSKKSNQIQQIQKVLLRNMGAVYLFKNADRATVIPVVNQPGKFIYDCGDETFLIYPVYRENADSPYRPVNICKTDMGTTIGVPVTISTFVKMGFSRGEASAIYDALEDIVNVNHIVDMAACSREALENLLDSVFDDDSKEEKERKIDRIYVKLLNLPVIQRQEFEEITGITKETIINKLKEHKVLYPWLIDGSVYRIDLTALKQENQVLFCNSNGGGLGEKSVGEIYGKLKNAVSSINFNYRINDDLPKQFTETAFCNWKFGVQRLTNPTIKKLKRKLETGGIDSFLNRKTQSCPEKPVMPFKRLMPTENVISPRAEDGAQIDFEGLYAEYNWELFYHIPLIIAQNFGDSFMHEDSLKWFHYIFDPTKKKDSTLIKDYWNFLPFAQNENEEMRAMLENPTAIQAYNDSPFNPHAIARLRINAYGKYTIMEYVSNLIEWGDSQFLLNTWESLTKATMMYVWAYDLLGPKPQQMGTVKAKEARSFDDIEKFYEGAEKIPQFVIDLEKQIQECRAEHDFIPVSDEVPFNDIRAYFGVPENDQLLLLWDIVEDRLYKLRNSLDINGALRVTALFEPALDLNAMVKAAAAAATAAPGRLTRQSGLYPYRFSYMIEQAKALASQLTQFGISMLSALEKNDAEALLLLTNTQEESLLQMATKIKENQLEEISSHIEALQMSKEAAQIRKEFYGKNAKEYMSEKEIAGFATSTAAAALSTIGGSIEFAAGIARLAPQVGSPFAMKYGGAEIGSSMEAISKGYGTMAGIMAHISQQTMTMANYDRRKADWELQEKQAEKEMENLECQMQEANARKKIAERDLEIHIRTLEQRNEVLSFLKKKFTGTQLYQWLTARLTTTMWQTYQLALEMGLTAQEAYQYERDTNESFLKFDYWDSNRKGLMAGEGLLLALMQMQQSYLKKNERRMEIEKNISFRYMFPDLLEILKTQGICQFELPEFLFAADYPAAYRRKIMSVSLTVPAVLPPYETIKATLKQISSQVLMKPDKKGIDYLFGLTSENPGEETVKQSVRSGGKIAVSRGVDDSGMFVLDFRDERYLPFEGTGAASVWQLEMPQECNHFDMNTISDIILCIKYTALEDEQRNKGSFYDYVADKLKQKGLK